jgi:hypothetical protein
LTFTGTAIKIGNDSLAQVEEERDASREALQETRIRPAVAEVELESQAAIDRTPIVEALR